MRLTRRSIVRIAAFGAAAPLAAMLAAACGGAPAATPVPAKPTEAPAKPAEAPAKAAEAPKPAAEAPKPAAEPTKPAAAAPQAAAPAQAGAAAAELQFWPSAEGTVADAFRKVVTSITEKKPNLKVTVLPRTYSNADEQKLITAHASQTGPDLYTHGGSSGGFWGSKGIADTLDARLKGSPMAGDYTDAILFPHRWKGNLHAVPWLAGPQFMVWRKDFFKEVGLDPEKGPATWQEQADWAQKLAKWEGDKIKRVGLGIQSNAPHFYFWMYMYQNGGQGFSDDFKHTRIAEKPGLEALEYVVDLFRGKKVNSTVVTQPDVPGAPLLVTGQVAISWERAAAYNFAKQSRPDLVPNFGFGMPPKGTASNGTIIFVDPMLMTAYGKQKDAAWQVMEGLSELDNLEALVAPSGSLVPRTSWYEKNAAKLKDDAGKQAGVEALKIAFNIHWGPDWTQYRIALIPFLEEAVLGKRTPKDALEAATKKLDADVLLGG